MTIDTPNPGDYLAATMVNFSMFILSLASSVPIHLGLAPEPGSEKPAEKNLPFAHQTIDIIALLEEKTRNNRTEDEEQLITALLRDLRMQYVAASSGEKT